MEHHSLPMAHELSLFLICAGLIVPFFKHIKINPVLGYLLIGMVIGPFGLGALANETPWLSYISITDIRDSTLLGEWGVIFLMFTVGLELSFNRLWTMLRQVFGLGFSQVSLSAIVIGSIAYLWGNSAASSVLLGGCLALSSTAIVLQLFHQNGNLRTAYGQTNISVLLMQDLAVVPMLFLVTLYGEQSISGQLESSQQVITGLLSTLAFATSIVIGMYFVGSKILSPILHMVAHAKSSELFLAATLVIIVVCANITGMAGLSMALGAFLAGMLLAESEFRHVIEMDIAPFKGLLLGLFFMTVGMGINLEILMDQLFWILASVIGLFVIKGAIITLLCMAFKLPRSTSIPTGFMLSQGGEFAFVVVGLALSYKLLPNDTGQFMLLVTSISMILTPFLAHIGQKIWKEKLESESHCSETLAHIANVPQGHHYEDHVVIAGFGRVARILTRSLEAENIPFICIEKDPTKVRAARQNNMPVYFGDVIRGEILNHAHISMANTLVVTMDDGHAAERLVEHAQKHWPDLHVLARAKDLNHAQKLITLGAHDVILETVEASLQISGIILKRLGIEERKIVSRIEQQRQEENRNEDNIASPKDCNPKPD
ncbi:MAG TPA: hypothetical protein DHW71_09080 [Gammaproteobacteria bacterium]|nr:hypothetical protein [Gammaproteobacteria bacterium]